MVKKIKEKLGKIIRKIADKWDPQPFLYAPDARAVLSDIRPISQEIKKIVVQHRELVSELMNVPEDHRGRHEEHVFASLQDRLMNELWRKNITTLTKRRELPYMVYEAKIFAVESW